MNVSRLRTLVILSLSILVSPSSYAVIDVSALGGLSLSNLNNSNGLNQVTLNANNGLLGVDSTSIGGSYAFGALVGLGLVPFFSVESGLIYARHHIGVNPSGASINTINSWSMDYKSWSLPVMLRFTPLPIFSVEAGPYFGLSSSTTANVNGTSSDYSPISSKDNGLIVGANIYLPILPLFSIRLSGLYMYGLSNIANSDAAPGITDGIKLRSLLVMAGLTLSI